MKQYFFVRTNLGFENIDLRELLYIRGGDGYLACVTVSRVFFIRGSVKQVACSFPEEYFIQVNRSCIVVMDRILRFDRQWVYLDGINGDHEKYAANRLCPEILAETTRETRVRIGKTYLRTLEGAVINIPGKGNRSSNLSTID